MAKIRWGGGTYAGRITETFEDGSAQVLMLEHGPRFTVGTVIEATAAEIVSRDETDADPAKSVAVLEAAMAEERKTMTPVAELLAKAQPEDRHEEAQG